MLKVNKTKSARRKLYSPYFRVNPQREEFSVAERERMEQAGHVSTFRQWLDLSQEAFAEKVGASEKLVAKIEIGHWDDTDGEKVRDAVDAIEELANSRFYHH
jgi:DNA-binding XRE family transcriptional regulator